MPFIDCISHDLTGRYLEPRHKRAVKLEIIATLGLKKVSDFLSVPI
jgi:hypothetical protein